MFGAQQEYRHLVAGHRSLRAVEANPTTARDALGGQLFDPGCGPVVAGNIGEAGSSSHSRRCVRRAMHTTQEEDGHLGAIYNSFGTV